MTLFKKLTLLIFSLLFVFPLLASASNNDLTQIKNVITKYEASVNHYDTNPSLADDVWQTTSDSSYIHPRGHEKGWVNIKNNFYQKTMVDTFVTRKLELVNEPDIHIYGNTAVVEFYWIFHAKFRKDNSPIITKGRETQVMVKMNNHWKIVHVHYSSRPVGGDKQGF